MNVLEVRGLAWMENGQSILSGAALDLYRRLDRMFVAWSRSWSATEYLFPAFIPALELNKLDYFRSFPHLVTVPATLEVDEKNPRVFGEADPVSHSGELNLPALNPVRDVLTPAACYHFYIAHRGRRLDSPLYLTTAATCYRKESRYVPLRRQWSFSMREIVCLGSVEEVRAFLDGSRTMIDEFIARSSIEAEWRSATDPFFNPSNNPRYLLQKLEPVKHELVFEDELAIASINFHRNYFGETFEISRDGADAFSGCVAFGIERWVYAIIARYGPDESRWPDWIG